MRGLLEVRVTEEARAAERRLHLPPQEDAEATRLAELAISTGTLTPKGIERMVAQPYIDAILDVRTKPLPRGPLKGKLVGFKDDIEGILTKNNFVDGMALAEYAGNPSTSRHLARSIARLITLNYSEDGKTVNEVTPRLVAILPFLSEHLQTETALAVEQRYYIPSRSLSRYSVFQIAEKLEEIRTDKDPIVAKRAGTIIAAALIRKDLIFADKLARGARAKYDELSEYKDPIVRVNINNILVAALRRGDLSLADGLAKGARAKYDELSEDENPKVRRSKRAILRFVIHRGNLALADTYVAQYLANSLESEP